MTHKELVETIADLNDITNGEAKTLIESMFDTIQEVLEEGEEISINKFGKFKTVDRAARKGRNPATGKSINIAATRGVSFKASSVLKKAVKESM